MLIDSHCHLNYPDFSDNLACVVARAYDSDVMGMVSVSTSIAEFESVYAITKQYENIWCSVGIHPYSAAEESFVDAETIISLSEKKNVVAIGESGLDYYKASNPPASLQKTSFEKHILAARETNLPLIIHSRNADEDMMYILEQEIKKGFFPFVLHSFSSGELLAHKAIALGGYISFSGIITFPKSVWLRQIAAKIPHNRILLETDSPYLAPEPFRGKKNEPAFIKNIASVLADVLEKNDTEIAQMTTGNFFDLFFKAKKMYSPVKENVRCL